MKCQFSPALCQVNKPSKPDSFYKYVPKNWLNNKRSLHLNPLAILAGSKSENRPRQVVMLALPDQLTPETFPIFTNIQHYKMSI